jgi:hypothetical protein
VPIQQLGELGEREDRVPVGASVDDGGRAVRRLEADDQIGVLELARDEGASAMGLEVDAELVGRVGHLRERRRRPDGEQPSRADAHRKAADVAQQELLGERATPLIGGAEEDHLDVARLVVSARHPRKR